MVLDYNTNKLAISRHKSLFTLTTILLLGLSIITVIQYSYAENAAYDTPTPDQWKQYLTTTPDGAFREASGITESPWISSPGGNPAKTGLSSGTGPATNHILWRDNIPFSNWQVILSDNGKIFTSSSLDRCMYALDENTGRVLWVKNDSTVGRWAVVAYNLIFTTEGGKPVAISQNTGLTYWRGDTPGQVYGLAPNGEVFSDGEALFVFGGGHGRTGNMTCLKIQHTSNGARISVAWTNNDIQGRCAYKDGKLYGVLEMNKWVSCVDAATGKLIWNFTGTGDVKDNFYPNPVVAYGNVYLGTENPGNLEKVDHVVCLNAETGEYKWTYASDEYFIQSISAAYGNIYIAGGERNAVHCVDGATGVKKWEYNAPGFIDYYTMPVADNKIYFVSAGTEVVGFPPPGSFPGLTNCISATTGELIWSFPTKTAATSPILIDGKLIVQTEEDYLWCHGKGPTTTVVSASSSSIASDQSVAIYGSVEDMSPFSQQYPEIQNPWVKGASVVLCYLKDGTWHDFATVQTDDYGKFSYNWAPNSAGLYTLFARFEGNDAYYWSSAETTLQVSTTSTVATSQLDLYIIGATVLIIIAIAIAVLLLRKR